MFEEEIKEQPEALQKLIDHVDLIEKSVVKISSQASRVAFFGMGSSLYSVIPAVYILRQAGMHAEFHDASEALWYLPTKWFNGIDVSVFVSQSGETVEIRKLVDKISDTPTLKLGITANTESYLSKRSDMVLNIFSGKERSVGSTKSHINSTMTSIIFSLVIINSLKSERENLERMPSILNSCIFKASRSVEKLLTHLVGTQFDSSVITSRGFSLGEVYQSALTFNEIARLNVLPISAGMLKHGPMEFFVEKKGLTCFIPDSKNKHLLSKLCQKVSRYAKFIWIISNTPSKIEERSTVFSDLLETDLPEYLQSILFLPYIQVMSSEIRKMKGIREDEFYLINKTTMEE